MKRATIILLFICNSLFGQTKQDSIVQFLTDHIGQKVGKGVCRNLVSEAFKYVGLDDPYKKKEWWKDFGTAIHKEEAIPGDIFYIEYIDSVSQKIKWNHIGFVYSVGENNMSFANENAEGYKLKYSEVVIYVYADLMEHQNGIIQKIYFFHRN